MPHKLGKISARSAQWFGGHFRKTHGELHPPPPTQARVSLFNPGFLIYLNEVFNLPWANCQSEREARNMIEEV